MYQFIDFEIYQFIYIRLRNKIRKDIIKEIKKGLKGKGMK